MPKSPLQQRAERAAQRFTSQARRPIVIEFAGVPKAGKTSTISQVHSFLKRCGFRVQTVIERASVCPIRDKKHANFNVWTACTTLVQVLEHTQEPPRVDDPQILILDRGLFDAIAWLTMMDRLSRIRTEDREAIERFLLMPEWRKRINGVVVMTVSPREALEREQGLLPVEGTGSIMNTEVLQQMLATTKECAKRLADCFRIFEIDTTKRPGSTQKKTAEQAAEIVISLIENHLQEEILALPKSVVTHLFGGRASLTGEAAKAVYGRFLMEGEFRPRGEIEDDPSVVQALPVVVVRNKSGDVLRLRRRERESTNPLDQEIVIWAGGHLRREDSLEKDAVRVCALRELEEELRLSVEREELQFIGAVYSAVGGKTSKHAALVFEWRAETDDVAVTLSSGEFFERRGTSLSGTFVPAEQLAKDVLSRKIDEPWSNEIVRHLLKDVRNDTTTELFS
jgi:predicted NUDIX family phosphoesterase